MSQNSAIKWFLDELPALHRDGIIDDATRKRLCDVYRDRFESESSPRYFVYMLAVFGGVLMAASVVLFCYYSWDMLSRPIQLAASALPLMLAAVLAAVTFIGCRGQLMRELSALATAAGLAVIMVMQTHIYHTGGTFAELSQLLLTLVIPFVYVFNSVSLATLCLAGLLAQAVNAEPVYDFWWAVGIAPYVFFHLQKNSRFRVWMRYLAMALALSFLVTTLRFWEIRPLTFFVFGNVFLLGGWEYHHRNEPAWRNPWLICAFLCLLVGLGVASSSEWFWRISPKPELPVCLYYWAGVGIMLVISIGLFLKRSLDAKRTMFALLLAMGIAGFFLPPETMCIAASLYVGLFGVVLMFDGARRRKALTFNGGLLMLLVLVVCRFFDTDLPLLARSAGFFILGLGFLGANLFFSYRLKREEA